nr:quinolinate synthase NadA [Desulfobacterales bacterium]
MIEKEIRRLVKRESAILLAHNYQPPEIQDIADLTGDSLELSIKASETDARIIIFCGVHFMAETASIVSPEKTVLLPRLDVGCPMADMITPEDLEARRLKFPGVPVVTYVNSSAAVKALSTICCTSANVLSVVNSIPSNRIFMTPDRNLALYAASKSEKQIEFWNGFCPIHDNLTREEVLKAKESHPDALFMAHPECRPEVLALADAVLSTSGMLKFARESDNDAFIVGTEVGLLHPLRKENPGKDFYPASKKMVCPDMKRIKLIDILRALERKEHQVRVPESIRTKAISAVEQMMAIQG